MSAPVDRVQSSPAMLCNQGRNDFRAASDHPWMQVRKIKDQKEDPKEEKTIECLLLCLDVSDGRGHDRSMRIRHKDMFHGVFSCFGSGHAEADHGPQG
jgi:hypothetical protein